jgi:hypothetical protein
MDVSKNLKIELTEEQKWALHKIVNGVRKEYLMEQTLGGYAGTGKAQPLHSSIITPHGVKTMKDIEIGNEVCTPNGGVAKVIGIYPQGEKSIYKICFSDGNYVECCEEHLWKVSDRVRRSNLLKYKKPHKVFSTSYIKKCIEEKNQNKRFYVENTNPVNFVSQKTNIKPYFLGFLLSFGSLNDNNFSIKIKNKKLIEVIKNELNEWNCSLNHRKNSIYEITENNHFLKEELIKLNLWNLNPNEKFIPEIYLINNKDTRIEILKGMVSEKVFLEKKPFSFTHNSLNLIKNLSFLIQSLGGTCCFSETKEPNESKYVLKIFFNNYNNNLKRCIKSIEYIGKMDCQCIMIDDPEHLYLTDHFIPTHNTTLIKYLTKFFPNFAVAAYTGKAANVLRKKKIYATTIHSKIYKPNFNGESVYFDLCTNIDCEGFIIDEASMVSQEIYDDLISFGLPIIFVGDHGQLEPVNSKLNLMEKPNYTLEEIHRNAGDIAKFAEHLRKGFPARTFKFKDDSVEFIYGKNINIKTLCEVNQVICAFNKTRNLINNQIREALKYQGVLNVGEKVMCLKNNEKAGLFNGMQGIVKKLYSIRKKNFMDFEFDGFVIQGINYDDSLFGQESYKIKQNAKNPFDYAYCITAHKSQGDEWDDVLVIEQNCKNWSHKRWSYTAASRAKTKLRWNPS